MLSNSKTNFSLLVDDSEINHDKSSISLSVQSAKKIFNLSLTFNELTQEKTSYSSFELSIIKLELNNLSHLIWISINSDSTKTICLS